MEIHFDKPEKGGFRPARARAVADLRMLAQDTQALLRATSHDASRRVRKARERVTDALDRANTTCREWPGRLSDSAKAAARRTNHAIRSHTYESIGMAFGLGFLAAYLVRRNRQASQE